VEDPLTSLADDAVRTKQMMARQKGSLVGSTFSGKVTVPLWKSKPSWHQISSQDRMIAPAEVTMRTIEHLYQVAALAAALFGCAMAYMPDACAAVPRAEGERVRSSRPDLILTNGVIHTLNPAQALAESVAVAKGVIVYVGNEAGALALRSSATRVIDLHGMTVLPGLADAHVHPALGEFLNFRLCNVRAFSLEEGFAKVRHCAAVAPPGDWVVGYGWYDLDNPEFDKVTRAQIDALVPTRKLAIISKDLHTVWANSKTLGEFGIGRDTKSPAGGEIMRDPATGEATGELIDAAGMAIWDKVQHHSTYTLSTAELLKEAMSHLNSFGITSIFDAFADEDAATAYHALDASGKLSARVALASPVLPSNYRSQIAYIAAHRANWQSAHVRLDYIKVFGDGNDEVGLSSMLNHDGPPETATPGYYSDAQMRELVTLAESANLSIYVHVIGDGATRQVLDAIASARKSSPETERRHTLTHLCWVADSDLPRFKAMNVIANIQEGWLAPSAFGGPPGYDYARSTASGPIGPWLAGRLMPYRALRDAGARLASGSDWFYTEENPWFSMEAGISSKDPGGANKQAMLPNYTLDIATLIAARTSGAAYQMYRENETGSIDVGKKGDLVVVDRDPFTIAPEHLHETKVLMTFLDGTLIYQAPVETPAIPATRDPSARQTP
jgi:predicted amidohydrolase YtcJ